MRMRRANWWMRSAAASTIALLGLLAMPSAATAADPVELGSSDFVDTVGALSGSESEVQAALDELYEETGVQLFVAYVDTFDGIAADESWAIAMSELNGLGTDDLLLAVAIEESNYDIRYPADFQLDEATVRAVEGDFLPLLSSGDWPGAVIAAADGYRTALAGGTSGNGLGEAGSTRDESGGGVSWLRVVGALLAIGAILVIVVVMIVRRRSSSSSSRPGLIDQKQLDLRVGSLLVQLDDSLKTSEQELGFAVAQFGDAASKPFVAVLDSARAKVAEAFELKQRLDDAVPETEQDKRTISMRIIELCEAADAELDAQAEAFDDLRELEKRAPEALASVRVEAEAVSARLAATSETLLSLEQRYSSTASSTVAQNPEQAARLLEFAGTSATTADAALAAGDPSEAAVLVRSAQASTGQANQLLDAIDNLAGRLADATTKLDAAVADTRQDLHAAEAMQADAPNSTLAAAIAAASAALESATDGESAGDPVSRLARIEEANARLDEVFSSTRDAQVQAERARRSLEGTLATARSQVAAASDFITTRRGGIGQVARTRVAEARRHLDKAVALSASDPVAALSEAQNANTLASNAIAAAHSDVSGYQSADWGGGYSRAGSSDAALAGLLGGLLLGAGSGRAGSGRTGNRRGGGMLGGGLLGGGGFLGGGSSAGRSGGFGGISRSGGFGGSSSRSSRGRF